MKGIFLARRSILALAALALTPFSFAQAGLAGDWQGKYVDANGTTFHLVWHVTAAPDGALTSTLDNVDESIFGIKAKSTTVKGSDVKIEVEDVISPNGQDINLKGSFDGILNKEENEVSGTWTQIDPPQDPLQITFKHGATQSAPSPAATQPATTPQSTVAGDWAGTMQVRGTTLHMILHITGKDGSLAATLDNLDKGALGLPVKEITSQDSKLNFSMATFPGSYNGTLNDDPGEINGLWT
jgi:hypothetical protein